MIRNSPDLINAPNHFAREKPVCLCWPSSAMVTLPPPNFFWANGANANGTDANDNAVETPLGLAADTGTRR